MSKPAWLIILLVGFFLLFALIALPENELDRSVFLTMIDLAPERPVLRWIMVGLTHAGGIVMMTAVALLSALAQWWNRQRYWALAWLVVPLAGGLVDMGLKAAFDRNRPPVRWRDEAVTETNESFPSGHSMGSAIGYGMVGYALWRGRSRRSTKYAVTAGLSLLVLGIGFSRIFLRAHWLTDVLAGFAIGLAWLALCIWFLEMYRSKPKPARGATGLESRL